MNIHLTKRYSFPASHRLNTTLLSDEKNKSVFGKCNHPHGHGHNYYVEVTVSGSLDPITGMVINLSELDPAVQQAILERYDHANLNSLPEFASKVPTTENLCKEIYQRISTALKNVKLEQVRIEETRKNSFVYAGEGNLVL
jgi:6-pyruvoyltetrahydropterin/6-carboxytetrahydropterin synthase